MERLRFEPDQIVEWTQVVDITSLRPHPENAKLHDDEGIEKSLQTHGQFRTIVVSQDGVVLAGNGTYEAAMKRGRKQMAVIVLPLAWDAPQAREILLVDNGVFLPSFDQGLLEALLGTVKEQTGSLEGTGYDDKFLAKLMKSNSEPMDLDSIKDDKSGDPLPEGFLILITCESELQQTELLDRFTDEGLKVKAMVQ